MVFNGWYEKRMLTTRLSGNYSRYIYRTCLNTHVPSRNIVKHYNLFKYDKSSCNSLAIFANGFSSKVRQIDFPSDLVKESDKKPNGSTYTQVIHLSKSDRKKKEKKSVAATDSTENDENNNKVGKKKVRRGNRDTPNGILHTNIL